MTPASRTARPDDPSSGRAPRTALVTGGNRGIGFEVGRQLARAGVPVVLAARDGGQGQEAAARLSGEGLPVTSTVLDVTDPAGVVACAQALERAGVEIDVVVNNAGIYPTQSFLSLDEATLSRSLEVNLMGPFRVIQAFLPGMIQRGYGRIVNVSSGGGALTEGVPGPAAYGIAKAGLNALTKVVAAAVPPSITVNAVCPGWVRTRMGGSAAPLSAAQGADTVVWLATRPDDGPTGGFFRERRRIPW